MGEGEEVQSGGVVLSTTQEHMRKKREGRREQDPSDTINPSPS